MLLLLLLPLFAASASPALPLWFVTDGPMQDLRRASADGQVEQVLVASLAAPYSPVSVHWLAVEKQVGVWTDNTGVRLFNASSALPGQRPTTLLEDRSGELKAFGSFFAQKNSGKLIYGAVALIESRVYVAEETGGVILEILLGSASGVRVVKSGFPSGTLTGGLSAASAGPNSTMLYWIASDGITARLFSGLVSDTTFSVVLDLSLLSPPSVAPTSLSVSARSGTAVWLDSEQNSIYSVDLGSLNSTRFVFPSTSKAESVASDTTGAFLFVSLSTGNVTQVVRLDVDLLDDADVIYDKLGSPCCGFVGALAVDSSGIIGACAAGTYTSLCVPCPEGTFSSTALNKSCVPCTGSEYCALGAAVPIPTALAQNNSFAEIALLQDAVFGDSTVPIIFLLVYVGVVVVVVVAFAILTVCLRHYRYETVWPKYKRTCQSIDVCFRGRHYNETPGMMIHRKSVIGAFQTLLFPSILIMLAVYVGISWNSTPIITSSLVPFGHVDAPVPLTGRIAVSAVFWGFAGLCDASSLGVAFDGDITSGSMATVINSTQYACNVTWDSGENFTVGINMQVTLTLSGGHAAFVGYSVVVSPHYLEGVPTRSPGVVFENYANETLMPSVESGVFKGDAPTTVDVQLTWALFNDSTLRAPIPYQTGWLLNIGDVVRGDQADNATFGDSSNMVSIQFAITRSSTYSRVLVQQTGTFIVVLGSIFAYVFTISNGLAAAGKGLEWAMRSCCKKQRSSTNAFFMAPYEGPQLEEMVGFKQYNTDADVKLKIMQRAEKNPSEATAPP